MNPRLDYIEAAPDGVLADLSIAIGLMNTFNRLAIGFRRPPEATLAVKA